MKRLPPVLALLLTLGLASALWAQADEFEAESITEQGTLDPIVADEADLQPIFEEAERLFQSFDQPDSIPLFDRLIARLESGRDAASPLTEELLSMLIESRAHRAEANFNLGENDKAADDLRRIIELDASWQVDPDMVSPKFVEMLDDLRDELVGELLVMVEPIDAHVLLDGQEIDSVGQSTSVLAGTRAMRIERAGFEPIEEELEIGAGKSTTVDHVLERVSAVARVRIRPVGATILIDGEPAQIASRELLEAEPAEEDVAIDGLIPGVHIIEIRKHEYRPLGIRMTTDELDDYRLPPAILALKQGEIRLSELPEGASVHIDGSSLDLERQADGTATVALAPGDHLVEIRKSGVGGFRETISVGDQEVVDLLVLLRPTIAFMGVLGSDRLAAADLAESLSSRFRSLNEWIWNDQTIEAPTVLDREGLDTAEFRRLAGLAGLRSAPDWSDLQKGLDDAFGASVYLLAVLGDDLYATTAELWIWSPAPWSPRPTRRTLALQDEGASLEAIASTFDSPLLPVRPHLGARFIDSAQGGPLAVDVSAGGPAANAGLAVGDRVLAVDGQPVDSVQELLHRLAGAGEVTLATSGTGAARELRLTVRDEPGVIDLAATDVLDPVMAARLSNELLKDQPIAPHWMLRLNQAALYLRAQSFQKAVPLLRSIQAPSAPGLGRAMVDYWLGATLAALDVNLYGTAARQALSRAAESEGARLYHADGPLLAPRARARLGQIDRLTTD